MTENNQKAGRPSDPSVMVIFGAAGDLTKRKLIPALCNLAGDKLLSQQFAIVGFGYNDFTTESFRQKLSDDIKNFATSKVDPKIWSWFQERIYYVRGDFADANAYQALKKQLAEIGSKHKTQGNLFYYLAVAPRFFSGIVEQLGAAGMTEEQNGQWRRVIIEKPFGHDLESARALNTEIKKVLAERQIYRIDHYLGKETVQNLMMFRFSNSIFEPIWNRHFIYHVQITAAETVGVE